MPDDRLVRILARLATNGQSADSRHLCDVCAEVTHVTGAGIMLLWDGQPQGSVCTTNDVSALIADLQYELGEGPSIDADRDHVPVAEPDLAEPTMLRWPQFARGAVAAGARAVFGFPVSVDDVHVGALNLYRDVPGPLTVDEHADALIVSRVAARAVLGMNVDEVGKTVAGGGNFRLVVHQAAGMVAVQLSIPVDHALLRLRAHAFSSDRPLDEVAQDVVARTLRLDGDPTIGG